MGQEILVLNSRKQPPFKDMFAPVGFGHPSLAIDFLILSENYANECFFLFVFLRGWGGGGRIAFFSAVFKGHFKSLRQTHVRCQAIVVELHLWGFKKVSLFGG